MSSDPILFNTANGLLVPTTVQPVESATVTTVVKVPNGAPLPISTTSWGDVVTKDLSKAPANGVLIMVGIALLIAAAIFTFLVIESIIYNNKLAADWVNRAAVAILLALGGGTLLGSQFKGTTK